MNEHIRTLVFYLLGIANGLQIARTIDKTRR